MSDLYQAMRQLAAEAEAIAFDRDLPNFADEETVQAVADFELAGPIAGILNARNWWLADKDRREEAVIEILKNISALERGLLQRWRDL